MVDLLGWGELILILGFALVIVGPKDLPKVFYTLGKGVRLLKGVLGRFQEEWDGMMRMEQLKELEKELSEPSSGAKGANKAPKGKRRPKNAKQKKGAKTKD